MKVEESGLGEERVADKPLGARQPRGPPVALLGIKTTDFPRRFLCCLLPLPIQCTHKPKRELVNVFVRDTALLRICGKSVRHFLTGGSGTGFEKEWILLKIIFF